MPRRKRKYNFKPTPGEPPPTTYGFQTADDPSKNYLLTRLPPSLRHKIYRLVLPKLTILKPHVSVLFQGAENRELSNKPFRTHEKGLVHGSYSPILNASRAFETLLASKIWGTVLALARCCKQLHDEIIPVYYGESTFSFDNAYDLYRFLYMIGPKRREWVRNIEFHLITGFRYSPKTMKGQDVFKLAFDVLADCLQPRKLYIGVSDQTTDGLPRKKERNLFAVREWGVFDSVKGLGEGIGRIDLKVREVVEWDFSLLKDKENVFEMDVKKMFMWRSLAFFQLKHEFERALSEDFRRPRDIQDENIDGEELD